MVRANKKKTNHRRLRGIDPRHFHHGFGRILQSAMSPEPLLDNVPADVGSAVTLVENASGQPPPADTVHQVTPDHYPAAQVANIYGYQPSSELELPVLAAVESAFAAGSIAVLDGFGYSFGVENLQVAHPAYSSANVYSSPPVAVEDAPTAYIWEGQGHLPGPMVASYNFMAQGGNTHPNWSAPDRPVVYSYAIPRGIGSFSESAFHYDPTTQVIPQARSPQDGRYTDGSRTGRPTGGNPN